MLIWYVSH